MDSRARKTVKLLARGHRRRRRSDHGARVMAIHQQQAADRPQSRRADDYGLDQPPLAKPPTVEATSMAVPSIKGPAPLPSEQEDAE